MIAVMGSPTVALESHSQSEGGRGKAAGWSARGSVVAFVWSMGSEKMNVPLCAMNVQSGVSGGVVVDLARSSQSAYQPASSQPVGECVQQCGGVLV